jgi:hypothetical protein
MRKAPDKHVCVDRIAVYYATQWTEPRLEDFEFLVHTSRAWKASARTSRLVVFTDTDSRTQLARTCRAHAECRHLSAPPFRHNRTTAAYTEFVQVLLGSLRGGSTRRQRRPHAAFPRLVF